VLSWCISISLTSLAQPFGPPGGKAENGRKSNFGSVCLIKRTIQADFQVISSIILKTSMRWFRVSRMLGAMPSLQNN
jgi:hypothetical protein